MLDWLPSEDLVPWRLMAADLLVGMAIAVGVYFICARLAARPPASVLVGGRLVRLVVPLSLAGLVILIGRGAYGPPLRLALTAARDRPAQRFADRVARSPELRAWSARRTIELRSSGESEDMIPRTLGYERSELLRNGFSRLTDAQLKLRTELLARAFGLVDGTWSCPSIYVSAEDGIGRILGRSDRAASEAWFRLIFEAMVADARGLPARRQLPDTERARILTDLAPVPNRLGGTEPFYPPTDNGSVALRVQCDRERRIYRTVSAWEGSRRAGGDLLLATADAYLTGELDDQQEEGVIDGPRGR